MIFAKPTVGLFKGLWSAVAVVVLLAAGMLYLTREPAVRAEARLVSAADSSGPKCSERTLRGEYAVRGDGWVPNGPPGSPMVPFANASLMALDGEGNLTNDITVSRNGQITRNFDVGTYTVGENCKGTMTINISTPPFQLTFDLVLADGGKEFVFIATTPSVVTHEAKRLK
jgi:hypothetical protein